MQLKFSVDVKECFSNRSHHNHTVARVMVLEEKFQPLEVRLENAQWIQESTDERLTLVTCWPNDDNTHRVIVVALPEVS